MTLVTRWTLIPAILAGWLCLATPAFAVAPEVKDEAGLFSADALKRANEVIADVSRRFKKDIVVETYKEVPPGKEGQLKSQGRDKFFTRWAEERMAALRTEGVYILICDNPKQIQIEVGEKTMQRDFRRSDADKLRRDMVEALKAKKPDQGLVDGVRFVSDTLQANVKSTTPAPTRRTTTSTAPAPAAEGGGGWGWGGLICMGLLVIGGIWLFVGLIRAFTGGWGGGGGYGPGGYGGGGGFMTSMLGGLFGAAAGMWMYNSFFGGHSSGFGSTAYGSEGGTESSGSDQGQAGYGTGDSWDNDSGGSSGGDWGSGGDSGGGGDWGGGGGDFGGGGGDW